jgi:integrase
MPRHAKPYTLYFRKETGYWFYKLSGGKWKSTQQTKEELAHAVAIEAVAAQKAGPSVELPKPEHTLATYALEAFDRYAGAKRAAGKALSETYVKACRVYINRWLVKDPIARIRLKAIGIPDFEQLQTRLLTQTLPDRRTTAIRILEVARLVLRRAEKEGKIPFSPDKAAIKASEQPRSRATFTAAELQALFPADPWPAGDFSPWKGPEDYTAFLVAASTGMRRGEILALDWPAVHLVDGEEYLEIFGSLHQDGAIGPCKAKRPRSTPFFDFVLWPDRRAVRALQELRRRREKSSRILGMDGRAVLSGPVFADPLGRRLGCTWWTKHFAEGLKAAGIDRDRGEGRMQADAHCLRHTLGSRLKAVGMPDDLVRRFCGWSSEQIQARYAHIEAELLGRIMKLPGKATS